MAKFGRYEFGKDKPAEEYCGDFMELEKGYVQIFKGEHRILGLDDGTRLVAAIHLEKGQSVREICEKPETAAVAVPE
jgi:hypothetical protein